MNAGSLIKITVAGLALLAGGRTLAAPGSTLEDIRALTESPDKVQRVACVNNLRQLGSALRSWAANSGDLLPPDLFSMSNELASPRLLVCPADTAHRPASDWASFTATNLSYGFLAPAAPVAAPQEVVLLCPIHGNVTLMDGSVQSRVARTHPEQFLQQGDRLYFGEPVLPAPVPNRMTMTAPDNPMTAPPTVILGTGGPGSTMDERMMRRYGVGAPPGMTAAAQTNPIPMTMTTFSRAMTAPPILTATSNGPSIRMDERTMQHFGLLPASAIPTVAQTAAGPEAGAGSESEAIERSLRDPDPKVRRAAIEKLAGELSEGAQVRLTPRRELLARLEAAQNDCARLIAKSLQDEDPEVRRVAVSALYLCGPSAQAALPQLIEVLQGTDWPLKSIAALALGNVGTNAAAAVPALEQLMNTTLGGTRTGAAQALWKITRQAPLVLPALIEALELRLPNSAETSTDPSAALTLAEIGPEAKAAVPALSRLLEAKDRYTRIAAAAALVRISPETAGVAEALAAGLQPPTTGYEFMAQRALRELGPRSLPVLVKAADDPSPTVRRLAIETLGTLGADASEGVPSLAAKLADPDANVRRAAANALGSMAPKSREAVPQLRAALRDRSGMVRTAAAVALIRVDPPGSEAVAVLVEAMASRESDGTAYLTACAAARELSPAAVPTLLEFLKGAPAPASPQRDLQKWFRAREAAIELLGRMGVNAQSAVPALVEILNNQRMPHRREAAEALGLIGPAALAAVPSLKAALADEEVWLRLNAAVALARIEAQDESHIRGLTRFLEDRDASLRAAAASSLGELGAGARSAIPDLRRLAGDDDDESVLSEVTRAVEAIEADAAK